MFEAVTEFLIAHAPAGDMARGLYWSAFACTGAFIGTGVILQFSRGCEKVFQLAASKLRERWGAAR